MSVLAFIFTPQNEYEKAFAVPVATEKFFYDCWIPAINTLNLQWAKHFSYGIEITKGDLDEVINELMKVKEWACHSLFEGNQAHILERIELLLRKLPEAFRREDAVLYIG